MADVIKIKSDDPYRADDRITVYVPIKPSSYDYGDGPDRPLESGMRVNADAE